MDLNLIILAGSVNYAIDDEAEEEDAKDDSWVCGFGVVKNLPGFVQRNVILIVCGCHFRTQSREN
jgi:hypothetical protein